MAGENSHNLVNRDIGILSCLHTYRTAASKAEADEPPMPQFLL